MRFLAAIDLATDGHEWLADQALAFAAAYGGTVDLLFIGDTPGANEQLRALLDRGEAATRGRALVQQGAPLDCIVDASSNYDVSADGDVLFQSDECIDSYNNSTDPVGTVSATDVWVAL